jgi:uncharacterized protein YjdB
VPESYAESLPPTGIELDEQTLDMFAGESRTLTATISPEMRTA